MGAALRPGVQLGNGWEDFWLSSQALGAVSAWWEAHGCAWEDSARLSAVPSTRHQRRERPVIASQSKSLTAHSVHTQST